MQTDTALQERLFKQLKPLKESTVKELQKQCFNGGFLFRYRDENNNRVCYCTHCETEIMQEGAEVEGFTIRPLGEVARANVNQIVSCPACGAYCRVKDAGRSHKYLKLRAYCAVIQKLHNQYIVVRTFCLLRDYGIEFKNVPMLMSEHYRIFYGEGKAIPYRRINNNFFWMSDIHWFYKQNNPKVEPGLKWVEASRVPPELRYPKGYYWYNYWTYYYVPDEWGELACVLSECDINSSKYFKYLNAKVATNTNIPFQKYLEAYIKHPVLVERLTKQGYTGDLLDALVIGSKANWQAKTVQDFFNCRNRTELKAYSDYASECDGQQGVIPAINAMFFIKKYNLQATAKSIEWFAEHFSSNNKYYSEKLKSIESLTGSLDYKKLFSKLIKEDCNLPSYGDYIGWCEKYNVEFTQKVIYPRSIRAAHDEMMQHNQRMEEARRIEKAKKATATFKKRYLSKYQQIYSFAMGNYLIAPFKSIEEIINEGKTQIICVGGKNYTDRYLNGDTILCKLRLVSEPDKPFVTVEVNKSGAIVQSRGYRNSSPPPEVKAFLQQWKAEYTRREKAYKAKHKKKQQKEAA